MGNIFMAELSKIGRERATLGKQRNIVNANGYIVSVKPVDYHVSKPFSTISQSSQDVESLAGVLGQTSKEDFALNGSSR